MRFADLFRQQRTREQFHVARVKIKFRTAIGTMLRATVQGHSVGEFCPFECGHGFSKKRCFQGGIAKMQASIALLVKFCMTVIASHALPGTF